MEAFLCRSEGGEEVETCGRGEDMLLCRSEGLEAVEDLAGAWEDGDIVTLLCRSEGLEAMEDLAGWGEDTGGMGTYGGATVNPKVMKVAGRGSRTRVGGFGPRKKKFDVWESGPKRQFGAQIERQMVCGRSISFNDR
jgi:hypothetical protein